MLRTEAFTSYQVVTLDSSLTASSIYKDDWGAGLRRCGCVLQHFCLRLLCILQFMSALGWLLARTPEQ